MTLERIIATGSGKLAVRVEIEGLPIQFVSDPGMELTEADGRRRVYCFCFFGERAFRHLEANLDPDMRFMTDMRLDTLPTTILYDSEGREVWRMVGMAEWESERVARLLDEAEAG